MTLMTNLPIPYQIVEVTKKDDTMIKAYVEDTDNEIIWRKVEDHNVISEDEIVSWKGTNDYLFSDSRKVLLSDANICIDDNLMFLNEHNKPYDSINCVWALWLDVDKYFGVTTHPYDSIYVNFYTNWNPYDGLTAEVTISGDSSEVALDWNLTAAEKVLLLRKLNDFIMSKEGISIYDYYKSIEV